MRVSGAEGLNASKVREHATARTIEWLIHLEIVTVTVDECDLATEADRLVTKHVDVGRIGVPGTGVGDG